MSPAVPAEAGVPRAFHVLAKPTGAVCNLDCSYCFFLSKELLYPGSTFRMAGDVLRSYVRQLIEAHARSPEVVIAWQGGEPTMMGLDFFRRAVGLAEELARPGQRLLHTMQTNGTLLTDEWADFLAEKRFLVGLSIDGPQDVHDAYRVNKAGRGSFHQVMDGLAVLRRHGVDWNALTTVHAANEHRGREVYRFLRDDCGARYLQFIPIIERTSGSGPGIEWSRADRAYTNQGDDVTGRSVSPGGYGRFLVDVFEDWKRTDIGTVFVQMFDAALANWYGEPPGLCVHSETCGLAIALEHTGDVYSCDHYVDDDHRLGNIRERALLDLLVSPKQRQFGTDKRDTLPAQCRGCDVRFACHGGCPKDRVSRPGAPAGLNYLCPSYQHFFRHIRPDMSAMCELLRAGRAPGELMSARPVPAHPPDIT